MAAEEMMFHRIDWYRPGLAKDQANSQHIDGYTLQVANVPCCIQPASASEQIYYFQRGMEVTHSVYTNANNDYARNDRLYYGSRRLVVVGVRDMVEMGQLQALDCLEYFGPDKRG